MSKSVRKLDQKIFDHYDIDTQLTPSISLDDAILVVEELTKDKIYMYVEPVLRLGVVWYQVTFGQPVEFEDEEGYFPMGMSTKKELAEAICCAALLVKGIK